MVVDIAEIGLAIKRGIIRTPSALAAPFRWQGGNLSSRNASFHSHVIAGVLLMPLKWFWIGLVILLGLIPAAWIVDWIFVFRVWPEGIARLQGILAQDMARTYDMACWCGDLPGLAVGTANFLYDAIFRVSGIHDTAVRFAEGAALSIPDTIVRNAYRGHFAAIQVAILRSPGLSRAGRPAKSMFVISLYAERHTRHSVRGPQLSVWDQCARRNFVEDSYTWSSTQGYRSDWIKSLYLRGEILLMPPLVIRNQHNRCREFLHFC
jgi:hypothetical protein